MHGEDNFGFQGIGLRLARPHFFVHLTAPFRGSFYYGPSQT